VQIIDLIDLVNNNDYYQTRRTIMKIILTVLLSLLCFGIYTSEVAGNEDRVEIKINNEVSTEGEFKRTENRIRIENDGENTQISTETKQQDSTSSSYTLTPIRSQQTRDNMSEVASRVEEMLNSRIENQGIGEQVREIAKAQNQAQERIESQLQKIEKRTGLMKRVIGPDFKAIKNMEKLMVENQERINELESLSSQFDDEENLEIEEMIASLEQQNLSLKEKISQETESTGLLGWLFKLFS
jgi:hypothetical protein